jgi:hypothetical protein
MSVDVEDFLVFETYRDAGGHAFSKGVVNEADKDRYHRIFQHLCSAVAGAIERSADPSGFDAWNCRFGRDGGVQGQRPLDLWASIINTDSDAFSRFPQVYAIASQGGVEVGFSVTIHEADYFNQELKRKNRSIIPIINSKLPAPDSVVVTQIADALSSEGGWKYGEKARQGPVSSFGSLPEVIEHLKSGQGSPKGGGSVYKILDFEEVAGSETRLEDELAHALALFRPVMEMLRPTYNESVYAGHLIEPAGYGEDLPGFDPDDESEGKKRLLRQIAIRQGQAKFRDELIEAYGGRCAVSGCSLHPILQAAHISPYNGVKSNHASNGILLRADIHTLFDLGLMRVDPVERTISVSASLVGTEYEQYSGRMVSMPEKASHCPSRAALAKKLEMFPAL